MKYLHEEVDSIIHDVNNVVAKYCESKKSMEVCLVQLVF